VCVCRGPHRRADFSTLAGGKAGSRYSYGSVYLLGRPYHQNAPLMMPYIRAISHIGLRLSEQAR
jgi:hypothetical protein